MADRRMFSRDIFKSSVMVNLGYNNSPHGIEAQRIFETLIVLADDWGRGRLIPEVIRGEAFISVPESFAKVTPDMIREWIDQIAGDGALTIYDVNGQEYYTLTGWDRYQRGGWQKAKSLLPDPPGFVSDGPQTDSGQTADTERTTDESKVNRKKEDKTVKPDLPDECIQLVKQLFPDLKDAEVRKQAETIEQLFRLDAYTMDDIEQVLKWAKTDTGGNDPDWSGWSAQFLSCCQLRVKKHGVMKFAKMKAGYERSKVKKKLRTYCE